MRVEESNRQKNWQKAPLVDVLLDLVNFRAGGQARQGENLRLF